MDFRPPTSGTVNGRPATFPDRDAGSVLQRSRIPRERRTEGARPDGVPPSAALMIARTDRQFYRVLGNSTGSILVATGAACYDDPIMAISDGNQPLKCDHGLRRRAIVQSVLVEVFQG